MEMPLLPGHCARSGCRHWRIAARPQMQLRRKRKSHLRAASCRAGASCHRGAHAGRPS
jgi:hypothetical protein